MSENKYFKDLGYRVTSIYGWRKLNGEKEFHPGVDLVTKPHGEIKAFTSGKVIYAGEGIKGSGYGGYGEVVAIQDKYDCVHVYGHLSKVSVKKGDSVKKDQVIGNQGNTGKSTGEHLHYEVRKEVEYVADREKRCYIPDEYLIQFFEAENKKAKAEEKPVAKTEFKTYKIQAGDTISEIAAKFKTTGAVLLKLNPEIKDANKIRAGQTIKVG